MRLEAAADPAERLVKWTDCPVTEAEVATSQRHRAAPYRIVFTTKRTITARPTQPHITPITMAVTSPVEGNRRTAA